MLRILLLVIGIAAILPVYGQSTGKSEPVRIDIKSEIVPIDEARPEIVWLFPDASENTIRERSTEIKVGILSHSAINQVTLMLNDLVMATYRNFDSELSKGYQFDAFVQSPLNLAPGTNKVELVVQNELGVILKHKRTLTVVPPFADRSDLALLFAFDEYDNPTNRPGPVGDAEMLAEKLSDFGFQIEIIRNPTTFEVLDKLEEYSDKQYKSYDQLFIYFTGQGEYDEKLDGGYLACKNSKNIDPEKKTYLPFSLVKSIVNNIAVEHILLTMDVCRDGTLEQPLRLLLNQLDGDKPVAAAARQEWAESLLNQRSRLLLTTGYDRSTNAEHSPSTFTQSYLNAFNAAVSDTVLT
ncbi:MAG: caspase family protein, partial [Cyclobacteriaceae bacterium]